MKRHNLCPLSSLKITNQFKMASSLLCIVKPLSKIQVFLGSLGLKAYYRGCLSWVFSVWWDSVFVLYMYFRQTLFLSCLTVSSFASQSSRKAQVILYLLGPLCQISADLLYLVNYNYIKSVIRTVISFKS